VTRAAAVDGRTDDAARRRLGWARGALVAYLLAAAAVLLSPVSPELLVTAVTAGLQQAGLGAVRQGWVEFAANVALFAPLGALLVCAVRRTWPALAVALAVSAGAELAQTLLPGRLASPRDVVANVLGAAIGAGAVLLVRRIRRPR
jgi:uncharacterized membrane protein